MSNPVIWGSHEFQVYEKNTNWNEVGGVYIFCGINSHGLWIPAYIGETESFRSRIPCHDRWEEAVRLGATHVHAKVVEQEATRVAIQDGLIRLYQPPMNSHGI
jgi:hypothetical protein